MTAAGSKPRAKRSGPGGTREGAGRPARGEAAPSIMIRVTVEEREECEQGAQREGKTLTAFVRDAALLRAATSG